jgi:hypothetical protein
MPRRIGVSLILAVLVLVAGCGEEDDGDTPTSASQRTGSITATGHALPINEQRGMYGPVAIGDSAKKVARKLGPAPPWHSVIDTAPLGAHHPDLSGASGRCRLEGQDRYIRDDFLRYEAVSMWAPGDRVCSFQVTAPDATTRRGVGIGDPLDAVETAYPELGCGIANENSEYATFPYCNGQLASGIYLVRRQPNQRHRVRSQPAEATVGSGGPSWIPSAVILGELVSSVRERTASYRPEEQRMGQGDSHLQCAKPSTEGPQCP